MLARATHERFQSFPGLKAYLELELSQPGISPYSSFAQIAFQSEGKKLYFKTFSPLTPHYFTLISRERKFWLKIPKEKTIFTGPLEAIGQESFDLKVTPQDFQRMIFPNPIEKEGDSIKVEDGGHEWWVYLYSTVGQKTVKERQLSVLKEGFRVVKDTRYSVSGNPYLEIQWENFQKNSDGSEFPTLITLFKPSNGYLLRIRLKKWEVTDQVSPALFEMKPEEGFKLETVSP